MPRVTFHGMYRLLRESQMHTHIPLCVPVRLRAEGVGQFALTVFGLAVSSALFFIIYFIKSLSQQ